MIILRPLVSQVKVIDIESEYHEKVPFLTRHGNLKLHK